MKDDKNVVSESENVSHSVVSDSLQPLVPVCRGFSRQEYWSGLPCPAPGDLPDHWNQTWVSCITGGFFIV